MATQQSFDKELANLTTSKFQTPKQTFTTKSQHPQVSSIAAMITHLDLIITEGCYRFRNVVINTSMKKL